jgi:hypothetical protein
MVAEDIGVPFRNRVEPGGDRLPRATLRPHRPIRRIRRQHLQFRVIGLQELLVVAEPI